MKSNRARGLSVAQFMIRKPHQSSCLGLQDTDTPRQSPAAEEAQELMQNEPLSLSSWGGLHIGCLERTRLALAHASPNLLRVQRLDELLVEGPIAEERAAHHLPFDVVEQVLVRDREASLLVPYDGGVELRVQPHWAPMLALTQLSN